VDINVSDLTNLLVAITAALSILLNIYFFNKTNNPEIIIKEHIFAPSYFRNYEDEKSKKLSHLELKEKFTDETAVFFLELTLMNTGTAAGAILKPKLIIDFGQNNQILIPPKTKFKTLKEKTLLGTSSMQLNYNIECLDKHLTVPGNGFISEEIEYHMTSTGDIINYFKNFDSAKFHLSITDSKGKNKLIKDVWQSVKDPIST